MRHLVPVSVFAGKGTLAQHRDVVTFLRDVRLESRRGRYEDASKWHCRAAGPEIPAGSCRSLWQNPCDRWSALRRAQTDMTSNKIVAAAEQGESPTSGGGSDADRVRPYVPRALQLHLVDDPAGQWWAEEGTAALIDISGFTQLSEQLAQKGKEGAEQITDVIGDSFESNLLVLY